MFEINIGTILRDEIDWDGIDHILFEDDYDVQTRLEDVLHDSYNYSSIKKWIVENCKDKVTIRINVEIDPDVLFNIKLLFNSKTDMLLFKMTWMNT